MTSGRKFRLHSGKIGAAITVQIKPECDHNQITGILADGTLKINLNAPAESSALNDILISYLGEILGINKKHLDILGGEKGSEKLVSILGLNSETVQDRILSQLQ